MFAFLGKVRGRQGARLDAGDKERTAWGACDKKERFSPRRRRDKERQSFKARFGHFNRGKFSCPGVRDPEKRIVHGDGKVNTSKCRGGRAGERGTATRMLLQSHKEDLFIHISTKSVLTFFPCARAQALKAAWSRVGLDR